MAVCEGHAGKGKVFENRRCGALAEPGQKLCVVHLKGSGYLRCSCGTWIPPAATHLRIAGQCPSCGLVHNLEKK